MNSRLSISNQLDLALLAETYIAQATRQGTRAVLVVITPPNGWLEEFAYLCNCHFFSTNSTTDRSDRISALLGSERPSAVVQLGGRPDLGLLAAIAGTVKAGGLMIVGTHSEPISHTSDSRTASPSTATPNSSYSNQRLERLATTIAVDYPDTMRCIDVIDAAKLTTNAQQLESHTTFAQLLRFTEARIPNSHALAEQDALLVKARSHLASHISSCIVIKGRRGCGKSSLLARLASHLEDTEVDFRITAMHESALSAYRQHTGPTATRYLSPESATKEPADVLLVDEAASVSLKQLQDYLAHYRHVVLCTTIEGYEASGRAFDVRLLSNWSSKSMTLLQLEPKYTWRWANDDPLDQFINRLILNQTAKIPIQATQRFTEHPVEHATHCHLIKVNQSDLIDDEILLASIHSLLHATHYQTTTKDLEHLLDAPTVQLWIQKLGNTVVGVLVLEHEGDIDRNLHEAILTKKRRLPNQLLPQLLAQTANASDALSKRYLRIIRLAVKPELRRRKLASQLLEAVTSAYSPSSTRALNPSTHRSVDAIGASFAADACSLKFWQSHGYIEFHRGFRSNPRTGKQAVAMMRSFEPITSSVLSMAAEIHHDNELKRNTATQHTPTESTNPLMSDRDARLLQRFASRQRSKHDTFAALQRLSTLTTLPMSKKIDQSTRQYELELRRHVQHWIDS